MTTDGSRSEKMGFQATWSMAVGGMVGGGIFSVLGVVVETAGPWAWLSFVIGGLIALCTAWSYAHLAERFGEGGGAFTFLREIHREGLAGSLSWVLVFGYVLTISVYAFTFGHYLAHLTGQGTWLPRVCAVMAVAVLMGVNLRGVGEASRVEVIAVWGKLLVLVGLAALGLILWNPERLNAGMGVRSPWDALEGAATVFMAYEGFQLLTYDYDDIRRPQRTLPRAMVTAVISVIVVYVVVTLGAAMLVGAGTLVEEKEVAIAVAGRKALGAWGLGLATLAAVFSTGSAINATLFATARLARDVARDGEMPAALARENRAGIPDRAVLLIGGLGALLAAVGSLSSLVEAASLAFLLTFATVNVLALRTRSRARWLPAVGAVGAGAAGLLLCRRLLTRDPVALGALVVVFLVATVGRPLLLRRLRR
jgi:amino acid transporter